MKEIRKLFKMAEFETADIIGMAVTILAIAAWFRIMPW